jgi:putative oxidoreductase
MYAVVSLVLRLALGGLFLVAAYHKLRDPLTFAEAIMAYRVGLPDAVTQFSTYAVPWTEVFCGVGLVLGLWTRAAALVFNLLIAVFLVGIVSVIARELNITCGCFGKFKLYCDGAVGWCKVRENLVLMAMTCVLLVWGGGRLSLDAAFAGGARSKDAR